MRSDAVKKGIAQAPQRSLMRALGLTEEEMKKPLVGIVSSYNEIVPGHMNLDKITEAVKMGVAMAGEGAVLVAASGEVFEAPAPKGKLINGVGAGDSMVAGFMAGYMEKEDYLHAFHMGIAAGSASAFSENLATREEIASVYEQITK